MNFIDEATITVQSGDGGRGCVSFRRERSVPRGGPDGGDGGKGGDVILKASLGKRTLQQFQFQRIWKSKNGKPGLGRQKVGKSSQDLIIEIPPGTLVSDAETGDPLFDFSLPDQTFTVAQGGRGGQGNYRFRSSTHQAPRFAQPGEPGEIRDVKLDLKLLADVGLVGLPNAGKSTLISVITSARPKIGSYPFTTLSPNLGVVQTDWGEPFVVADIPGLIAGAHKGAGLGIKFLRHIERTRILVHLVDITSLDENDPLETYRTINHELRAYDAALAEKPQILVLNKLDVPGTSDMASRFVSAAAEEVILISAATGDGVKKLLSRIVQLLERADGS